MTILSTSIFEELQARKGGRSITLSLACTVQTTQSIKPIIHENLFIRIVFISNKYNDIFVTILKKVEKDVSFSDTDERLISPVWGRRRGTGEMFIVI